MAFAAFAAVAGLSGTTTSPDTSNARSQPSRQRQVYTPPPLVCGGCGAPLSTPGGACSYCQRGGVLPAASTSSVRRVEDRVADLQADHDRRIAWASFTPGGVTFVDSSPAPLTIGVDPVAPAGDQIAVVRCDLTASGPTLTPCSFDAGTGSDW